MEMHKLTELNPRKRNKIDDDIVRLRIFLGLLEVSLKDVLDLVKRGKRLVKRDGSMIFKR
jgi:hypothetical protein